ncbi:MAG: hypothetical protein ACRD0O_16130 [Acidimicrobiia bacterium]
MDVRELLGPEVSEGSRLPWREEMITVTLGAWMLVGGFIDGWAHLNVARTDSALSPWHAVFYTGYLALAAWLVQLVRRRRAVPAGYRPALVGVAVFAAGAMFDGLWHGAFGVEADVPSLLSPSHLTLAAGMALMFSGPFRAAFRDPADERAPSFRAFLPVVGSLTLMVGIVSFFFMELTLFRDPFANRSVAEWLARYQRHGMEPGFFALQRIQDTEVRGVAALLVSALLLTVPVLLLRHRWRTPPGTVTFLFGAVAVLMTGLDSFEHWPFLVAALAAGGAGDWAVSRLGFRLAGAAVPALVTGSYMAAMAAWHGVGWVAELWTGSVVLAAAAGWTIAWLMTATAPGPLSPREPTR